MDADYVRDEQGRFAGTSGGNDGNHAEYQKGQAKLQEARGAETESGKKLASPLRHGIDTVEKYKAAHAEHVANIEKTHEVLHTAPLLHAPEVKLAGTQAVVDRRSQIASQAKTLEREKAGPSAAHVAKLIDHEVTKGRAEGASAKADAMKAPTTTKALGKYEEAHKAAAKEHREAGQQERYLGGHGTKHDEKASGHEAKVFAAKAAISKAK